MIRFYLGKLSNETSQEGCSDNAKNWAIEFEATLKGLLKPALSVLH